MDPTSLKYAKTHEWLLIEGDVVTIGISDFAVTQLTDLVYIDLPAIGTQLESGEAFGEVESVKAVSDLYAPVAGEVIEVNETLPDDLGVLTDDPYGQGWMIKLRISDPESLDRLLNRADYEKLCDSE